MYRKRDKAARRPVPRRNDRHSSSAQTDSIRALLREFGLRPQRGFGQNFLREERYLHRIAEAADLGPEDLVVEVGPGLGALTRELSARVGRVVAIEIDRGMAAALRQILADCANVEIVNADVLDIDPSQLIAGQPYKVVANLPYYITAAVLRHFLEAVVKPSLLIVMVQREVAERIVARPGNLNLLAISVQFYGTPRIVSLVPAQAFYPTPRVDSAIVRVDLFEQPAHDVDPSKFFRVVQAGFSAVRKQLHNALSQRIWLPPGAATDLLLQAGIDPQRRARTLHLEEWAELCRVLDKGGYV